MGTEYKKNSITLTGAVAMGTGVMIGAGIFALIGIVGMALVFLFVRVFLARNPVREGAHDHH